MSKDTDAMHTEFLPIENYVPHRAPMLLLGRLLAADEDMAVAEVTVTCAKGSPPAPAA